MVTQGGHGSKLRRSSHTTTNLQTREGEQCMIWTAVPQVGARTRARVHVVEPLHGTERTRVCGGFSPSHCGGTGSVNCPSWTRLLRTQLVKAPYLAL